MRRYRLGGIGSVVAVVAVNLYWWRRERLVREGLTVSRDWKVASNIAQGDVREATEAAGTSLENLPEEVSRLQERIEAQEATLAQHSTRLGSVRARWARSWLETVRDYALEPGVPQVLGRVIPGGETADAEAMAQQTEEHDQLVAVIGADGDGTFVVTVGEDLTDDFSAADLARELAEEVGGEAGGSPRWAMGGGANGPLEPAIDALGRRIEKHETFG